MPYNNGWPYTDVHQLNLDWIVDTVKDVKDKTDEIDAAVETSTENANAALESANAAAQSAEDAHDDLIALRGELSDWNDDVANLKNQVNTNTQNIAVDSARIDAIISGTTPDANAELIDIRVGANGVTYATAGDAVRQQDSDLNANIKYVNDFIGSYNDDILTVDNSYIDNQGYSGSSTSFHRSIPIAIPDGLEKLVLLKSGTIGGCAVAFFTKSIITHGNFISGISVETEITPQTALEINIPSNAEYMVFSCRKTATFLAIDMEKDIVKDVLNLNYNIDKITNGYNLYWVGGVIDSSGTPTTGNNNNFYSNLIKKDLFDNIEISCSTGYMFSICSYNNETFIERSTWYTNRSGVIKLSNSHDYKINIATYAAGTGATIDEMLENYIININSNDIPSCKRAVQTNIEWVSKMMACQASGKVIHFSFDDVWEVLYELITDTPASIWSNAKLLSLKNLHEATGACFTLNTFNEYSGQPDYDIADVPTIWQNEWQSAKGWLKFSFHAKDDNTNYATATTALTDYNYFVNAIYSFTGDYECIDRVARLGFFGGTLSQIEDIRDTAHGVIGLLSADDTRIPYYLNQTQTDQINKHGRLYDNEHQLFFIKSLPRIDSNSASSQIAYIENIKNIADKYIEVFSHNIDTDRLSRIQTVSTWANANGFTNGFLTNYFD